MKIIWIEIRPEFEEKFKVDIYYEEGYTETETGLTLDQVNKMAKKIFKESKNER